MDITDVVGHVMKNCVCLGREWSGYYRCWSCNESEQKCVCVGREQGGYYTFTDADGHIMKMNKSVCVCV